MRRISIVGSSGSGKTTLAEAVADILDVPHLELDSVYHQPDWQPLPDADFRSAVAPLLARDSWVIDGNYNSTGVQELIWQRCDTIVWLDLPRWTTMRRVTARSIKRSATREELWNGNTESWTNLIHPNPKINIIAWTWTRYAHTRRRYEAAQAKPDWSNRTWIRLRSQREIDSFVETLR